MACIFCKIINKEIPGGIVFENEDMLAFRDINPQAPKHIVVIPKKHIPSLNDISDEDSRLLGKIQHLVGEIAVREGIAKQGYRLVLNCGPDGGQTVEHLHYHLLGGRKLLWPPG
jgi:histidine triad (HIT) family protein